MDAIFMTVKSPPMLLASRILGTMYVRVVHAYKVNHVANVWNKALFIIIVWLFVITEMDTT